MKAEEVKIPQYKMVTVTITVFEFVPKDANDFQIPEGIDPVSTMKVSFKISSEEELSSLQLELNQAETENVEKSIKNSKENVQISRPESTKNDEVHLTHEGKAFTINKLNITLIGNEVSEKESKPLAFIQPHYSNQALNETQETEDKAMTEEMNKPVFKDANDIRVEEHQTDVDVEKKNETKENTTKKKETVLDLEEKDKSKASSIENHLTRNTDERVITSQGASGLSSNCNTPRNFKPLLDFSVPLKK